MSAPEFRALFNNPAFKHWYNNELDKKALGGNTSFVGAGRSENKDFVSSSLTDFVLTATQLNNAIGSSAAAKLESVLKADIGKFPDIAQIRTVEGQEQIIFPAVRFGSTKTEIAKRISDITSISKAGITGSIEEYLEDKDLGHVFGFANTLIQRARTSSRAFMLSQIDSTLKSANNIGDARGIAAAEVYKTNTLAEIEALDKVLDSMLDVLIEYDIKESSGIKGLDADINVKYRKTASNWLTTWESSVSNQKSGSKLIPILGTIQQKKSGGRGIRGLLSTGLTNPDLLSETIGNFVNEFITNSVAAPESSSLSLLNQRSSPSMKELIVDNIVSAIAGSKGKKYQEVYTGTVKLPTIPLKRVSKKNTADLRQEAQKIQKLKKDLAVARASVLANIKKPRPRPQQSLVNLESIIRAAINQQVARNMGNGSESRILNYRTGRLAESVTIDRVLESRQGMISVFYNYMKNPYATFSESGRQQSPKTRDPKALISKSIRELAAPIVGNRLRSVLV